MISSWAFSIKDDIDGADFDGDSEALDTTGIDFFVFVLVRPMVQDSCIDKISDRGGAMGALGLDR
jgi:hypothetical protein